MYEIIKNVIQSCMYELSDMLQKIDTIWLQNEITKVERLELIELARANADKGQSIVVLSKLQELDIRVTALEQQGTQPQEYPEYIPGTWYYRNDTCTYNGNRYTCTAPEGAVCVWSPEEYPAYWQEVE